MLMNTVIRIERSEIEKLDTERVVTSLGKLLNEHNAEHFRQQTYLVVEGYGNDSRELYEIPEVCAYIQAVNRVWPFWCYFLSTDEQSFLPLIALCLYPPPTSPVEAFNAFVPTGLAHMKQVAEAMELDQKTQNEMAASVVDVFQRLLQ